MKRLEEIKRESFVENFSQILLQNKLINKKDLKDLYKLFKDRNDITFEDFLLEEGIVTKPELLNAMSRFYNVPAVDVMGQFFDHYLMSLFPKDVMTRLGFIPLSRERDTDVLTVIAANPANPFLRGIINKYIFHDIIFNVGLLQDIRYAVQEFHDSSITPQQNHFQSMQMERSQIEVYSPYQDDYRIPLDYQLNDDDYESH